MSLTDDLRSKLSVAMGRCPTCDRGGLSVQRFLSGRQVTSDFLDKVSAWLESKA